MVSISTPTQRPRLRRIWPGHSLRLLICERWALTAMTQIVIEPSTMARDGFACGQIFEDIYATTDFAKGRPPLIFDWPAYKTLEDAYRTRLFVARHEGRVVGFVLYLVSQHLHHADNLFAHCDMLGVHPDTRGSGIGRRLVEYALTFLRRQGVTHVIHMHRSMYEQTTPLFAKLGFEPVEIAYMKAL